MPDIHNQSPVGKQINNPDIKGNLIINNIKWITPITFSVLIILAFVAYQNWSLIEAKLGWDKIFSKNDTQFKILVLPFQIMCKDNPSKDIGKEITDRLRDLNLKDTLNIHPYYFSDYKIPPNFSYETAEQLQKYHRADLIIYGSYYDDQCTNADGEEVCYNWITDEKWALDTLQQNTFTTDNYQVATMQDVRNGKVQGGTDYVIYWVAGITAYEQIQYKKAARYWLRIREGLSINNYNLANKLGLVFKDLGQYRIALRYCTETLAFAKSEMDTAETFNNLAMVYQDLGEYERARDLLEKALVSVMKNFSVGHHNIAVIQSNLALVYQDLGEPEPERARDLLEKALASVIKNFGESHPDVELYQSNLAIVYRNLGEHKRARDLLEKALATAIQHFGKSHPNVARCQSNLAIVYQALGEYERACDLLEKALASDLQQFSESHPNVAVSQSNLALVYKNLGEYERARDLLEKALAINIKNFGESHPNVATAQSNLGWVYYMLGEYERARDFLEKALASDLQHFGESHPNVAIDYNNLVKVYAHFQEWDQAQEAADKSLSIRLQTLGAAHPYTRQAEEARAWLQEQRGGQD